MQTPWDSILRALDAEPQETKSIRGASGFAHQLLAVGTDQQRRRLLVVSPEGDPRVAAMVQADLQAADASIQVLTARPIILNASRFLEEEGADIVEGGNPAVTRRLLDLLGHFQMPGSGIEPIMQSLIQNVIRITDQGSKSGQSNSQTLKGTAHTEDDLSRDRAMGICPLPLYAFTELEIEVILSGTSLDTIREALLNHGIAQYFFPSPDQVLLGLADRQSENKQTLERTVAMVPSIGHPFADSRLVDPETSVTDLIDALTDKKYLVEGELTVELTEKGRSVRSSVRFKPQESLLTKIINRLSLSISLKDLFGGH